MPTQYSALVASGKPERHQGRNIRSERCWGRSARRAHNDEGVGACRGLATTKGSELHSDPFVTGLLARIREKS